MSHKVYKVVIVGDSGCGKTSFVKRHLTGNFNIKPLPTVSVEVHPLLFHTTEGTIHLNTWDCSGNEKSDGFRDGYYIGAEAVIVMFDVTNQKSFESVEKWVLDVFRVIPINIPIALCGNKVDVMDRVVKAEQIQPYIEKFGFHYFDVSAKSNYNYEKPFLYLLRKLTNKENLQFK